MDRVDQSNYDKYVDWAGRCRSNQVYPRSIAEEIQAGDIFADHEDDPRAVLFWHYCGFGYLSGNTDEHFLEEIYKDILNAAADRRFLLITDDPVVIRYYSEKPNIRMSQRIEYRFAARPIDIKEQKTPAGKGIHIERIDSCILSVIKGRITPSFSWNSKERFLENGFGYAALEQEKIAAAAFTAAISSEEIDIGVETKEEYRRRGFAHFLVDEMCREILAQGKRPVWAHAEQNIASGKIARDSGFVPVRTNIVISRNNAQNTVSQDPNRKAGQPVV